MAVAMNKQKVPAFRSEAEEARWWYAHREELDRDLEDAARKGTLKTLSPSELLKRAAASRVISIRLHEADLARLRRLAALRGRPCAVPANGCLVTLTLMLAQSATDRKQQIFQQLVGPITALQKALPSAGEVLFSLDKPLSWMSPLPLYPYRPGAGIVSSAVRSYMVMPAIQRASQ